MNPSSPYRPGREIARGGMGAVLDARDHKLGRSVAMKVMLRRNAPEEEEQRFLQEARVLGQLAHPNIVPVHDVGTDEQGRLFYTMKLVQGVTLHDVIGKLKAGDKETLAKYPLNALLTAFQKVCDAVAFAHSRGIIHRDLKPQNIMVGEFGEVLVMDWGIAKILPGSAAAEEAAKTFPLPVRSEPTGPTGPTGTVVMAHFTTPQPSPSEEQVTLPGSDGQRTPAPVNVGIRHDMPLTRPATSTQLTLDGTVLGTPNYMSPEQAHGRIADLDERSDVYSLGGILYALLTLRPPVEGKEVSEVLNKVVFGDITAPGEVARHKRLPHLAGGSVPEALSAVAMKALALQRRDRYPDVAAFEADIAAYQGGFATSAENAKPLTLLRLFLLRHKTLTAAVSIVVLLTVAFITKLIKSEGLAQASAIQAAAESRRAVAEAEKAIAVSQFLTGMFDDANPLARHGRMMGGHVRTGPGMTARDLLDRGVETLQSSLKEDPALRAILLDKLGNVYLDLGLYSQAAPLVEEALALRRKQFGPDHPETAGSIHTKGMLDGFQSHYAEALAGLTKAMDIYRKAHGEQHPRVSDVALDLGLFELANNNYPRAQALMLQSLTIRRAHYGPHSREALAALLLLATVENIGGQSNPDRFLEAAKIWDASGRTSAFESFATAAIQAVITTHLDEQQALPLFEAAERQGVSLLGTNHVLINFLRGESARSLRKLGREAEAGVKYQIVITGLSQTLGPNCEMLIEPLQSLGTIELGRTNYAAAEAAFRHEGALLEAQARRKTAVVRRNRFKQAAHGLLTALLQQHKPAEAEQEARLILRSMRTGGGFSCLSPDELTPQFGLAVLGQAGLSPAGSDLMVGTTEPARGLPAARLCAKAAAVLGKRSPEPTEEDRFIRDLLLNKAMALLKAAAAQAGANVIELRNDPDLQALQAHKDYATLFGKPN